MKIIKKFWGIIPIVAFFLIQMFLLITEESANLVLRGIPDCILFWFFLLAVLVLTIYIIMKFFSWSTIQKYKFSQVIKYIVFFLYGIGVLVMLLVGGFISSFAYSSEEVVVENGVKMVARDTSYLGFSMEYYEYKNMLFRGKQVLKKISNKTYWIYNSNGELIETGIYDN